MKSKKDIIRKLAECIAEDLFINGTGIKAHRLAMMDAKDKPGAGWDFNGASGQIEKTLRDELAKLAKGGGHAGF